MLYLIFHISAGCRTQKSKEEEEEVLKRKKKKEEEELGLCISFLGCWYQ